MPDSSTAPKMWTHLWIISVLAVALKSPACYGYSSGAPQTACTSLAPKHRNNLPQESSPPYRVEAYLDNGKVRVSISHSPEFQGFLLQARSKNDNDRIVEGTFEDEQGVSKTVDCFEGKKNTLTHTNPNAKRGIDTVWTPAPGTDDDVIFRAAVAKSYSTFWTDIDSAPIRVKREGSSGEDASKSETIDYSQCSITKGCFGLPDGCVDRKDCQVLVSYAESPRGISFTMEGSISSLNGYIATGISDDNKMGDDSVTECFIENGGVSAQESWNRGKTNQPLRKLTNQEYRSKYQNGIATCSWIRPYETTVNRNTFNLLNSTYYILIAKGEMKEQGGGVGYHTDGRIASAVRVNFTVFESVEGAGTDPAIKVHGTFMVTAWIGFVSLGILLARHFKSVWENKTLCGVKIWFAFHRGFMIVGLAFAVIAFIVIFVYKKGWDSAQNARNSHAILGCIAIAFGLFQPIMALFRPSPDDPKRPIFNWLHWAVGNGAQIIAVITIFFAKSLDASGLKESFYWVMAVFVVVHCFFHFVFQLHAWSLEKKKNNEIKMLEMTAGRTASSLADNRQKAISGNVFRVLLLGVYCIFLLVIILALYALIGTA